jgi:2-polyprenyl-3-methyl-5-hydroxy-6-metoxy-1,4-benzoquinol methylase
MDLMSLYVSMEREAKPLRVRQKSLHFLEAYQLHLERYRGRKPCILEIGCGYPPAENTQGMGGSLRLWREWFGAGTKVCGIDIIKDCIQYADSALDISVEIGSQIDNQFLSQVIRKHGPFDIIIDDGSHIDEHMKFTFNLLFPYLKNEGTYIVEDINDHVKSGNSFKSPSRFVFYAFDLSLRLQKYGEMVNAQHEAGLLDYNPETLNDFDVMIDSISFYRDLVIFTKKFREKSFQMPMPPHYYF